MSNLWSDTECISDVSAPLHRSPQFVAVGRSERMSDTRAAKRMEAARLARLLGRSGATAPTRLNRDVAQTFLSHAIVGQ